TPKTGIAFDATNYINSSDRAKGQRRAFDTTKLKTLEQGIAVPSVKRSVRILQSSEKNGDRISLIIWPLLDSLCPAHSPSSIWASNMKLVGNAVGKPI